jgi:hypothetical protein
MTAGLPATMSCENTVRESLSALAPLAARGYEQGMAAIASQVLG